MNKIAICGAGPAGLAMALMLTRAGHEVEVIERFSEPAPVGSGLILQPTGLTVLHHLGLYDRIMSLGHRIDRLWGTDAKTGRPVLDVHYGAGPFGRFGLAVQRAALFETLHDAFVREGIPILTGRQVVGVRDIESAPVLVLSDGSTSGPYCLAIDATGSRSQLMNALCPDDVSVELAYGAFWATLDAADMPYEPNALVQRYEHASVMIGVLPVGRLTPDGREKVAFFWSQKIAEADRTRADGIDAWKARLRGYWPEASVMLEEITGWEQLTLARYQHRTLARPARGRVVFIGDAAHCTSPQLGQGANMALLDAAALAHGLATKANIDQAIDRYCRGRRNHVRLFQLFSRMFTPFYQGDSRALSFIRDQVVSTVARIPPAPRFLASLVSGTMLDPFSATGLKERDWIKR
ncbi:FAD-dependent monooxygenase [Rhizobium sp. TH2]|uniref:FAD-dependent oxidoreductase n=1 Tax=Rhizobium sp. TH2 TaxID=2775403 RepID=UPI0021581037|nr:NAD(P)/FAD-dependent oxidoreductase [Rhizobium sp. TH2]UVC06696.1 FAD-dependent monooxygenase [Rhizobium sp. TH2]